MTHRLIVAYTTRAVEGMEIDPETLVPPSNYKSDDTIAKWRKEKAESMAGEMASCPYTGTFDRVQIFASKPVQGEATKPPVSLLDRGEIHTWDYEMRVKNKKPPMCLAIRNWLLSAYPDAWNDEPAAQGPPQVIFTGFGIRTFLKMLGTECTLPHVVEAAGGRGNALLPLSAWYGNSDHRDLEHAVIPQEFKGLLTWPLVLKARGLDTVEESPYKGWDGPHQDVEKDLAVSIDLAWQLGLLTG